MLPCNFPKLLADGGSWADYARVSTHTSGSAECCRQSREDENNDGDQISQIVTNRRRFLAAAAALHCGTLRRIPKPDRAWSVRPAGQGILGTLSVLGVPKS